MNKYLKESFQWAFIALPYVYLSTIWNQLPERVPTHFNMEGIANDWSNKDTLLFIPGGLGIIIYFSMLIVPFLDPKKKIQQMGDKYSTFRLMLTIFISLLATYMLYVSNAGSIKNSNMLFALLGLLFAMLGNYLQTVRQNYFIGIRTPWTLESEQVWKSTHRLAGRLWTVGGVLITILAFLINNHHLFLTIFFIIIGILSFVPYIFSYIEFRKEKNMLKQ